MKIFYFNSCISLILCLGILACTSPADQDTVLFTLNIYDVKEEIDLPVSLLIESLDIVYLENKEEAYGKMHSMYASENYIGSFGYKEPYKLFNRKGEFIGNIGNYGQGPGEYTALYHSQIDEKYKRIYLCPFSANKILTYDFKGNFLPDECIPLAETTSKTVCYVDNNTKRVTVLSLPFKDIHSMVCWTQDFSGKILQFIPSDDFAVYPDFSNEVETFKNTSAFDFRIGKFFQENQDSMYHYNIDQNRLVPVFTLKAPRESGDILYNYVELPANYLIPVKTIDMNNNPDNDIATTRLILADKNTQEANYVRVVNDFLGGWELDPMYLTFMIRNGYFVYKMEPMELIEKLDEVLEKKELSTEMNKKLTAIRRKIDVNDNNIVLIGKLKL